MEVQRSPALGVTPPQGPQCQPFAFAVQRAAGQLGAWLPAGLLEQITPVPASARVSSGSFAAEKQVGRFDRAAGNGVQHSQKHPGDFEIHSAAEMEFSVRSPPNG